MTTQTWDRLELDSQFSECETLKQVIDSIEGSFSGKGEVICEIRVNGLLLDESDEKKFAESSTSEIQVLEVRANKPDELIRDALQSTLAVIPDLEKASYEAAEKLRGANVKEGQHAFGEVLQGCQWFFDTLMHVRGAASGTTMPIGYIERWFEAEKLIGQVVGELSQAFGKNDSVLLADLLEYEVTGALAVWNEVIVNEQARRV